ncbi:uncharacterized protein [Watersipora subatra]|uniref:uncharacterized protein n=1 Tax=Watersipora subatra TaxID=2589382 RepID=UPI00355C6743
MSTRDNRKRIFQERLQCADKCVKRWGYCSHGMEISDRNRKACRFLLREKFYQDLNERLRFTIPISHQQNGYIPKHSQKRMEEFASSKIQLFETRHLKEFKAPSIFYYHNVGTSEYKDAEGKVNVVPTVAFSTKVDGEEVQGTLTMPSRYALSLKENYPGIIIYKGLVTSHNTREYYDVVVMGHEEASRFYESSAQCKKDSAIIDISDDDE